ncbi:MAG: hypothetical protein AAF628_19500 [Planctomycetota bacterium]
MPRSLTVCALGTVRTATPTASGVLGIGGQVAFVYSGDSGPARAAALEAAGATGRILSSNVTETEFVR